MNIHSLSDFIYEDLNAQVSCVVATTSHIEMEISCDDPIEKFRRSFRVTANGVVESTIAPLAFDLLRHEKCHVLLDDHIAATGYLAFASRPDSPELVFSKIYAAHQRHIGDWRPLSHYINELRPGGLVEVLEYGMGMLAQGPIPVLEAYQESVSGLLSMSLVRGVTPTSRDLSLLLVDGSFVIAEHFECVETTAPR